MRTVAILVMGMLATPAPAVDAGPAPAAAGIFTPNLGFDLSFSAALPNDRRFSGSTVGYGLSLLTVADRVDVGLLHEEGHFHGHDAGTHVSVRSRFNAIRLDWRVVEGLDQQLSLNLATGHISFHDGLRRSAFAADLGVSYDPWVAARGGVSTAFGIALRYRYCHVASTDVFGTSPVDDAGGFFAGVHGLVRF
jgi:hypothetical protein